MNNKTKKYLTGAIILIVAVGIFLATRKDGSNSGGKSLTPESVITHGHGLAVDVTDANKLYIATHHGLLLLMNEKELYRVGQSRDDYMGFSPHPTDPNIFFSSGHPSTGGNIGFQKSEDGGFTWIKISNGAGREPVDFHAMAVSPVNSNIIFGWYRGDLQRTTDGGQVWERIPTDFPIVHLTADTKNESVVYASSPMGLYKSSDKGNSWQLLFDGFVATTAVNPQSQSLLSFSQKYGLAQSIDGGETWQKINEQFHSETPLFISYYRQNPQLVYLLTEKNSVYKSTDGGSSWNKTR